MSIATVLVAEDRDFDRDSPAVLLESEAFRVLTAHDGVKALSLVLLGIRTSGLDGLPVLRRAIIDVIERSI